MHLIHDADLKPFNGLGVAARARALARVEHWYEIEQVLEDPTWREAPLLILGDGTNVLFRRPFPGLVLRIENEGVQVVDEDDDSVLVRVAAGENWNGLVAWAARRYFWGIENLAAIPGSVGAAPIQNIGAYGVALSSTLESVTAWDRRRCRWVTLDAPSCGLGYRTSRFRGEDAGRFVITEIALRLGRHGTPQLDYPGVREAVGVVAEAAITPQDMAGAISRIRGRKLPDPRRLGNLGSFFKNPVVDAGIEERLRVMEPDLPAYPEPDGRFKLSAGWFIDRCGWKGRRAGHAGVYHAHALVLVNHGDASGEEVWELARRIQADVHERYGLNLEPEPTII